MRMAYLAYPIDFSGAQRELIRDWRIRAQRALSQAGFSIYTPGDAWGWVVGPPDRRLQEINTHALDLADVVLAYLPDGVRTLGVPFEVGRAQAMGTPTAVVGAVGSWAFPDTFSAIDDAVRFLKDAIRPPSPGPTRSLAFAGEGALPTRAYADDAGLDLYTSETTLVALGGFADVPCGLKMELPKGVWALLTGRSSLSRQRSMFVVPAIIDTGYRGPLFAGVQNFSFAEQVVEKGERIAQLVLMPNVSADFALHRVDELAPSARSSNGFGSSGR